MSLENITVNGKPLRQHIREEESNEIQKFLAFEIRSMRRGIRYHTITAQPQRPAPRPQASVREVK